MNSSHLLQASQNPQAANDILSLRRNPSNAFRQAINPHSLQQVLQLGPQPSQSSAALSLQIQQQAASSGAARRGGNIFPSNNRVNIHRRLPQGPLSHIGHIQPSGLGRRQAERTSGANIASSSHNSNSITRVNNGLEATIREHAATNQRIN